MPETKDKPPASQNKIPVGEEKAAAAEEQAAPPAEEAKAPATEEQRAPTTSEQQAALNVQAFHIEASRRTGLPVDQTADLVQRLQTEGDFFDEKGRWTLDVAGYPVCHIGWKPEKIDPSTLP